MGARSANLLVAALSYVPRTLGIEMSEGRTFRGDPRLATERRWRRTSFGMGSARSRRSAPTLLWSWSVDDCFSMVGDYAARAAVVGIA
jgi:hypothetical protein